MVRPIAMTHFEIVAGVEVVALLSCACEEVRGKKKRTSLEGIELWSGQLVAEPL
jgi:hypothetical protein